jgi:hypothetical protein
MSSYGTWRHVAVLGLKQNVAVAADQDRANGMIA